jgi:hypothetical protein
MDLQTKTLALNDTQQALFPKYDGLAKALAIKSKFKYPWCDQDSLVLAARLGLAKAARDWEPHGGRLFVVLVTILSASRVLFDVDQDLEHLANTSDKQGRQKS